MEDELSLLLIVLTVLMSKKRCDMVTLPVDQVYRDNKGRLSFFSLTFCRKSQQKLTINEEKVDV